MEVSDQFLNALTGRRQEREQIQKSASHPAAGKNNQMFHNEPNARRCSALEIRGFAVTAPPLGTGLFSIA
jgi:hypothetical protein